MVRATRLGSTARHMDRFVRIRFSVRTRIRASCFYIPQASRGCVGDSEHMAAFRISRNQTAQTKKPGQRHIHGATPSSSLEPRGMPYYLGSGRRYFLDSGRCYFRGGGRRPSLGTWRRYFLSSGKRSRQLEAQLSRQWEALFSRPPEAFLSPQWEALRSRSSETLYSREQEA